MRLVLFLGKVGLSLALVVVLLIRLDVRAVGASLARANWPPLVAAAMLLAVSNVLGSLQWGALLRAQGSTAPTSRIVSAYFVGLFFNNFLPANVGGDVARITSVAPYSPALSPTVSATVMDRLIGLFVIAAFGIVSAPLSMREVREPLIYALVAASFAGAGAALLAARSRALLALAVAPVRAMGASALAARAERTAASLRSLASRGGLLFGVMLFAALIQVLRVYVHFLVARALGIRVSEATLWTFVPILAVVAALPISLNGLGVREWAASVLLPSGGVPSAAAFAWQLTTALVALVVSLAGAVLFLRAPGSVRVGAGRAPIEEGGRPSRGV
jgi:uncharacterized membrane protein YbhN (UPF0104 family)